MGNASSELLSLNILEYKDAAKHFKEWVVSTDKAKADRRLTSLSIADIMTTARRKVKSLKIYIEDEFGSELYTAKLPEFGLDKLRSKSYNFPNTPDKFISKLEQTVAALKKYEMTEEKYSLEYWSEMLDAAKAAFDANRSQAGTTSMAHKSKKELRAYLDEAFRIIKGMVEINWRTNTNNVLEDWGFQRNTY